MFIFLSCCCSCCVQLEIVVGGKSKIFIAVVVSAAPTLGAYRICLLANKIWLGGATIRGSNGHCTYCWLLLLLFSLFAVSSWCIEFVDCYKFG